MKLLYKSVKKFVSSTGTSIVRPQHFSGDYSLEVYALISLSLSLLFDASLLYLSGKNSNAKHRQQMERRKTAVVCYVMIALNIGCHYNCGEARMASPTTREGLCYTAFYPLD